MTATDFTDEELHGARDRAFAEILERFPNDKSVTFIRKIDKIIAERLLKPGSVKPANNVAGQVRGMAPAATGEQIIEAIKKYQKETGNQPATVAHWTEVLLKRGIILPPGDIAAKSSVSYHVTRNKGIFEPVKALSTKSATAWKVIPSAL